MTNITKDNDTYTVKTESFTSKITVEEARKYNDNKGFVPAGIAISIFAPALLASMFNSSSNIANIPDVLSQKAARQICLQESFDKVSSATDEIVNLSKPEIKACASKKIIESGQDRVAAIKQSEQNKTKMSMGLGGIFGAIGLGMVGYGFVSNMYLRRKKPGIKEVAKAERIAFRQR